MTDSTINDVEIGRQTELEAGATYVFDKGYYHFGWWKKINATKAFFVTRVKVNTRLRKTKSRYVRKIIGDGFRIIADDNVVLASKGDSKLAIPLRRIKVKRDKGGTITLITTISNAPQSRLRPSTRGAGRLNCCSAGSSSISIFVSSSATTATLSACKSSPR